MTVLKQFSLSHTRGSSHGASRITRHSYTQNHYTKMMPEAYDRWKKLANNSKTELFKYELFIYFFLTSKLPTKN